jgi:ubiquinone biosynthesis protein UbiJ
MWQGVLTAALDRHLDEVPWWRERLAAHAGAAIRIEIDPLPPLELKITESGRLLSDATTHPAVTIRLRLDELLRRRLLDRESAIRTHVEGEAAIAELLAKAFSEPTPALERWFAERFGPIVGLRLLGLLRAGLTALRNASEALAANLIEALKEEKGVLPTSAEHERLKEETAMLVRALDRLRQRIERLDGGGKKHPT